MAERLRVAMLTHYPADAVLPAAAVKPKYRACEHPASWIRSLCRALAAGGEAEITVYVHSRAVARRHEVVADGFRVVFLRKHEPIRFDPFHRFIPALWQLRREFAGFRPQVVHGHGAEAGYMYMATRLGVPSVISVQGILALLYAEEAWKNPRRRALQRFERVAIGRAGGIVAKTEFAARWACSVRPDARIRQIANAVNEEFFAVRPDFAEPRVIMVGGLTPNKNPALVIRAFSRVRVPGATLHILGDGPERAACERWVDERGLRGRVELAGRLERTAVAAHMARARVLAMASRMETSPNVISEAHAAGLPVIAPAVGGIPSMVEEGRDGYLVSWGDERALADRMERMLASPELARAYGAQGRQKVDRTQRAAHVAAEHLRFYREVIG
jgi:glycosyltransferase involved in cell wall biosynthesis